MENKLTLQDCFKYPNAPIQIYEEEMPTKKCSDYEDVLAFILFTRQGDKALDNGKLILRKIESLTEEEKKQLEIIHFTSSCPDSYRIMLVHSVTWITWADTTSIDYLRSLSIDIDNLIERGMAIWKN